MEVVEDINSPINILGASGMINKDLCSNKKDINDIEREMVGLNINEAKQIDPIEVFNASLSEIENEFGVALSETSSAQASAAPAPPQDPLQQASLPRSAAEPSYTTTYTPPARTEVLPLRDDPESDDEGGLFSSPRPTTHAHPYANKSFSQLTEEQQHQRHIDNVIRSLGPSGAEADDFSVERERQEDIKSILLEDIETLKSELLEDDVDISRIPEVTQASPIEDVENVYKIIKHKYDRRRYCSFADDFILAGVHGLELIFDGKRRWGPYRPDLTDWHNTVKVKLRRMRFETSTIVSDIMRDYDIGPGLRILLELVPSAILHSKIRSRQHGQEDYSLENEMAQAHDELRDTF